MNESLIEALEDLKRADHLIYVSLKYSRTVDVIRSVIERLISSINNLIEALIEKNRDSITEHIPPAPAKKCDILIKIYQENDDIIQLLNFYLFLRKVIRANFRRVSEFRRPVALISKLDEGTEKEHEFSVDIDLSTEYYLRTKRYFEIVHELMGK